MFRKKSWDNLFKLSSWGMENRKEETSRLEGREWDYQGWEKDQGPEGCGEQKCELNFLSPAGAYDSWTVNCRIVQAASGCTQDNTAILKGRKQISKVQRVKDGYPGAAVQFCLLYRWSQAISCKDDGKQNKPRQSNLMASLLHRRKQGCAIHVVVMVE